MRTFKSTERALQFLQEEVPWGCAAGVCKSTTLARSYAQVGMTIIGWGSMTMHSRPGNPGDNFYYDPVTRISLNALGIPNRSVYDYLSELAEAKSELNKLGAQLWPSVSAGDAFDPVEYEHMAQMLADANAADVIEGNFSCPNIEVDGKRKPVVCFDLNDFRAGVKALRKGAEGIPIAAKIAPSTEARWLSDLIDICLEEKVDYLVESNTIGNCYIEEQIGKPVIPMVRGGAAGSILVPIVSGMLQISAPRVKGTNLKLIAAGGIDSGRIAYQYLRLGAHGFAFNTVLSKNGGKPDGVYDIINGTSDEKGLLDLLVEHGLPG